MAKRNNENISIGEALKEFVSENKLQKGLDKVNVKEVWNSEMGAPIAKYTTAIKLDRNTLYVQLSSSVLREELSYGKEKIIAMLNEKLGKELVKKLVLK
ncbi:MAG TPA: DUF721 domain-containing protein [Flavobacteriaceae bacterium]|nr:DUF721 domain-containing protein [Flavobacteriaceae bacterium]